MDNYTWWFHSYLNNKHWIQQESDITNDSGSARPEKHGVLTAPSTNAASLGLSEKKGYPKFWLLNHVQNYKYPMAFVWGIYRLFPIPRQTHLRSRVTFSFLTQVWSDLSSSECRSDSRLGYRSVAEVRRFQMDSGCAAIWGIKFSWFHIKFVWFHMCIIAFWDPKEEIQCHQCITSSGMCLSITDHTMAPR